MKPPTSGPEFLRCPTFLPAAGSTIAISPYGCPDGLLRDSPPHVADVDFTGGVISPFVRERVGPQRCAVSL
jgi:hypothetical protein